MRTLKKALSLVLVLAMVFALAVPGFAADTTKKASDYKDYSKVTNTEAVDVLTAIGVLHGNTDGTFGPEGNFTRAEAATLITYMLLGDKIADALPTAATKFSDVPASFWGAKYIAYCAEAGIVNGYGDGKFGPNDKLTANQWALMLLQAVKAKGVDKVGGASWEIQTTKLAMQAKLATADDLTGTFNRDAAAKLALNALFYTEKGTTSTYIVKDSSGKQLYKGTDAVTALLMKQGTSGATLEVEEVSNGSLANEVFKLTKTTATTDEEAFARPATKYTQEGAKTNPIAVCANKAVLTYTAPVTGKNLYKDLGRTTTTTAIAYYVDGKAASITGWDTTDGLNANATWTIGGNGTVTEVYKTGDDSYTITEIVPHFSTVKSVKTTTNTTTGVATTTTTLKNNKTSTEFTSFAKNDAVIYTAAYNKDVVASLQTAKKVSGALTKATTVDNVPTFTIGGKDYQISAGSTLTAADIKGTSNANMGKTVDYYVDNYGYLIAAVDPATEATGTYIQVLAADKSTTGANYMNVSGNVTGKVYGVLSNGTYGEYTVNYTESKAAFGGTVTAGTTKAAETIYKYTTNSTGELVLTAVTKDAANNGFAKTTASITSNATSVAVEGSASKVVLNNATAFMFFQTTSASDATVKNFSTKTGNANSGNVPAGAIAVYEKGIVVAVFVGGQYVDPSTTADIVYVDASTKTTSTEVVVDESGKQTTKTVYSYTAYTADGETLTVTSNTVNLDANEGTTTHDALYYYNTDKTLGEAVADSNVLKGELTVYGSTLKVGSDAGYYSYNADNVNFMKGTTDATLTSKQTVIAVKASTGNTLTHIWVLKDAPEA